MRRAIVSACGAAALLGVGTSSALAGPPELGRCVKVATGTGLYATANCTSAGGEKKFEWLPGPGPKAGFSLAIKPATALFIEGATSHAKVPCLGATGTGTVTGAASVTLALTFTGCEKSNAQCNTPGAGTAVIPLPSMSGEPGVVKAGERPLKDRIGMTLAGEWGFECADGAAGTFQITGAVIGAISPTNGMTTVRKWMFTVLSKTRQSPERFEGGLPQTFTETVNGTPEGSGFYAVLTLTSEEKLEINTVV